MLNDVRGVWRALGGGSYPMLCCDGIVTYCVSAMCVVAHGAGVGGLGVARVVCCICAKYRHVMVATLVGARWRLVCLKDQLSGWLARTRLSVGNVLSTPQNRQFPRLIVARNMYIRVDVVFFSDDWRVIVLIDSIRATILLDIAIYEFTIDHMYENISGN